MNGFRRPRKGRDLTTPPFENPPAERENPVPAAGYFCEGLEVPGRDVAGAAGLTGYDVSYSLIIC